MIFDVIISDYLYPNHFYKHFQDHSRFFFGAACLSISRLAKDLLSEKRWKRTEL